MAYDEKEDEELDPGHGEELGEEGDGDEDEDLLDNAEQEERDWM